MSSTATALRQPMTSRACYLYLGHRTARAAGQAGFLCQAHVWLDGRGDEARLRRAVAGLARRFPLLTSRVVEDGGFFWQHRPGATPAFLVHQVADEAAALAFAEKLLATDLDLSRDDPISFHLLRLGDGRDLFLVHYDHTLIGNAHSVDLLLAQLERFSSAPADEEIRPLEPADDPTAAYVERHRGAVKLGELVRRYVVRNRSEGHRPLTLAAGDEIGPTRIHLRHLDAAATEAFRARVRGTGLPGVSMPLLASTLRAMARVRPQAAPPWDLARATVSYALRSTAGRDQIFHDLGTELRLTAAPDDLADRDLLARGLVAQLRHQLRERAELAGLALQLRAGTRLPVSSRGIGEGNSLSYGFFRRGKESPRRLCGASVGRVYHPMIALSGSGAALSVTEAEGLILAFCCDGARVPRSVGEDFLEALVSDLLP